jgi:transposase-like protein
MDRKKEQAESYKNYRYSYPFKRQVIEEIENGQISMNQASKKYELSRSTIQKWFTKMGNFDKKLRTMQGKSPKEKMRDMKARIDRLELEKEILTFAIDMISEETGTDMLKKYLPESQEIIKKRKIRS